MQNQKVYKIKSCGTYFADPVHFLLFLENTFNLRFNIVELKPPDLAYSVSLKQYNSLNLEILAPRQPLFYLQDSYEIYMNSADVFIFVIGNNQELYESNLEHCSIFKTIYFARKYEIPVITLLNDVWCGSSHYEPLNDFQIEALKLPSTTFLTTKIGYMPVMEKPCCEGGIETLNIITEILKL